MFQTERQKAILELAKTSSSASDYLVQLQMQADGITRRLLDPFGLHKKTIQRQREIVNQINNQITQELKTSFQDEEKRRREHGASLEDLLDVLKDQHIAVDHPIELKPMTAKNFILNGKFHDIVQYVDISQPNLPNNMGYLEIVDNRVLLYEQSIFLHLPKYAEALYLKILATLGDTGSLEISFLGSSQSFTNYFTDRYEGSFQWKGWVFSFIVNYDSDSTITPGELTREDVIEQLKKYTRTFQ